MVNFSDGNFEPLVSTNRDCSSFCFHPQVQQGFTCCGTYEYMAPELIKAKGHTRVSWLGMRVYPKVSRLS